MKKILAMIATGATAAAVVLATGVPAAATLKMQKDAKAAGVAVENCLTCHNEKMPKKDAQTLNAKGKWLVEQKDKKKAAEVDGAWLKDYVEPKK